MSRLIRSELLKLSTVRSTGILLGFCALASGLLGFIIGLAPHRRGIAEGLFPMRGTMAWFNDVFSGMQIAEDFALVLGILIVTGEWRHKTATPTFLTEPRRERVTAAKLVVSIAAGVAVAIVAGAAGLVLGAALVADGYGTASVMLGQFRAAFPGITAVAVLFAIYGVGIGSLLKNQVLALVTGLGVTAVVEPIIIGVWPSVGRWLPSAAARALEPSTSRGAFGLNVSTIAAWQGAIVLLAYGLVLALAGTATTVRADIT